MGEKTLYIGEIARQIGINPKTVRYYEDIDLLPRPKREENNYRVYSQGTIRRLNFIKKAQSLGFTLREVREILCISDRGDDPCGHIGGLLKHRVADLEKKLKELKSLRAKLRKIEKEWAGLKAEGCDGSGWICPKIEKYF